METLYNCFRGRVPFRLNARAFSLRSSNMSLPRIREIMRNLEVDLSVHRVVSTQAYSAFLAESTGRSVTEMKNSEIQHSLSHVDELVSLRNDLSHGVTDIGSIEDINVVRARASDLRAFASAINEVLVGEVFLARIARGLLVKIDGEVHVFHSYVVCFLWPSGRLLVGDYLVMKSKVGNSDLRHGPILSIEVDGKRRTEVDGCSGLVVCVRTSFKVKKNGTYYVWSATASQQGG